MESRWFDCHSADCVVGAMIATHLVDWQELHKLETDSADPVDKLSQGLDVPDAKVILPSQRKQRCQNPGNLLLGRQIHLQLRRTCQSSTNCAGISFRKRDGL